MLAVFFNDCLNFSALFLFAALSTNSQEAPKKIDRPKVSFDTSHVILRLLEMDVQKKLDTTRLVYQFGNTREYIQGQIISRGKGPRHPDTLRLTPDDSNHYSLNVPNGSRIRLTFADRNRIWLNSGTTLTFAGKIKKSQRLQLNGEACFDVKENNDPLIIESKGHKMFLNKGNLDLNTFDSLLNYASLSAGDAILYDIDSIKVIELTGDRAITYGSNLLEKRYPNPTVVNSWTHGFLEHDQTLNIKTYFYALGRWYDVSVKMPHRQLTFGWEGRFPLESNFKNILKVFEYNDVKLELKLNDQGKMQLEIL